MRTDIGCTRPAVQKPPLWRRWWKCVRKCAHFAFATFATRFACHIPKIGAAASEPSPITLGVACPCYLSMARPVRDFLMPARAEMYMTT